MSGELNTLEHHMHVRRCVECGYDGALLRGGDAHRCARCGCDLERRPARSYAEMEGFVQDFPLFPPSMKAFMRQDQMLHRWLAFMFFVTISMVAVAYLMAAFISLS